MEKFLSSSDIESSKVPREHVASASLGSRPWVVALRACITSAVWLDTILDHALSAQEGEVDRGQRQPCPFCADDIS